MGNVHDGIHLAGNTGVVHGNDDLGFVGDGFLDLGLVNVHGIGADVHKDQSGTGQHCRRGRAGEGIAGQNDLIPGLQVAQQHGHVQGGGTAGGQQHFLGVEALLQPGVALFGKGTVTADLVGVDGLFHIVQFIPDARGNVKRNHNKSLLSWADIR